MRRFAQIVSLLALSAPLLSLDAVIDDLTVSNARSSSMGGAGIAAVSGTSGVISNPAVLGFMARETPDDLDHFSLSEQRFGWDVLNAELGATLTGDLWTHIDFFREVDFGDFDLDSLQEPESVEELIRLSALLSTVDANDTIMVNATASSTVQIGHFAVGVRSFGQLSGWIEDVDLVNVGLQFGAAVLASELDDAMIAEGFDPTGYSLQVLSSDQAQALQDAAGLGVFNQDTLAYLDFKIADLVDSGALALGDVEDAVDGLIDVIENSDTVNQITSNQTTITGRGFLAVEVPISYGYAVNDNFSIGLTAKVILGRVYGTQVWVFNRDNDQILENTLDSYQDSVNLGIDLGMLYRTPSWQFALTGYNLNNPTFDGYDQKLTVNGTERTVRVQSVQLEPQVKAGAAWLPSRRLTLAGDIDLLQTDTLLQDYTVQRLSFGAEYDLSMVQLRLGTYKNIAESEIGWVLTGGLGFQLWALDVNAGGAVSIDDTVEYDSTDYPRTMRLFLSAGVQF
ncbi:conjugal transfer protein TraF [Coraliomargarita akajimensis]|uniref:Membrane protein involved in aromatic hydrocarbon degradation n=1 Tax=Coraliomargarita akajimensis (strain DSM 45221 / IAM 15411 / JCM 23193 / KCTC 12865 / 04OKA010-24) TaxID=583355 RepID=D5EPJ1_CORAD|nr:conjugal transfer protein TraF [Coraliomargarita akajimensis]ADE53728.1 hypothetical protein Caka_0704 [Coraliomargarita akajimensis DSM 45221]